MPGKGACRQHASSGKVVTPRSPRSATTPPFLDIFGHRYYKSSTKESRKLLRARTLRTIDDYAVVRELGQRGTTFLAHRQGELFVLKATSIGPNAAKHEQRALGDEARAMVTLANDLLLPITTVKALFLGGEVDFIVSPYCRGGSLLDRIAAGDYSLAEKLHHLLALATAALLIHKQGHAHQDIKPANVLLGALTSGLHKGKWRTMLGDCGSVQPVGGPTRGPTIITTLEYAAPELFEGAPPTTQQDIWAWGMTAIHVLREAHPYPNRRPSSHIVELAQARADMLRESSQARRHAAPIQLRWLRDLLLEVLAPDPSMRPSAQDVVHAILQRVRFEGIDGVGSMGNQVAAAYRQDVLAGILVIAEQHRPAGNYTLLRVGLSWAVAIERAEILRREDSTEAECEARDLLRSAFGEFGSPGTIFDEFRKDPTRPVYGTHGLDEGSEKPRFDLGAPVVMVKHAIDLYCQILVSLVEGSADPRDIQALDRLAREWSMIEVPWSVQQITHFAQACALTDHQEAVEWFIREATRNWPSDPLAMATVHELLFGLGRFGEASAVALALHETSGKIGQNDIAQWWLINACIDLFHGRQYDLALRLSEAIPVAFDMLMMVRLICLHRLGKPKRPDVWNVLRPKMFDRSGESPMKTTLILQCAAIYGDREYCEKRAAILLEHRAMALPKNRQFVPIIEAIREGTYR